MRTYDTWKATNPADNELGNNPKYDDADDSDIYEYCECDCCGGIFWRSAMSHTTTSCGLETFACEECRQ